MTLPLDTATLTIDVQGVPIPQGSMIPVKRGKRIVLISDNPRLTPWRADIAAAAAARMRVTGWTRLDAACAVTIDFWLPRPASASRREHPCVRPDVDKLARACLDSLTAAGVIEDDARVCTLVARKHYALRTAGARIEVKAL